MIAQHGTTILTPGELARQRDLLVENFPNYFDKEAIIDVQKIDSGIYKVKFTRQGVYCEAFVEHSLNSGRGLLLIETDASIDRNKIPKVVKAGLNDSRFKDWNIARAFISTTPYSGELYRLDIYEDSCNENATLRVYFDDKGHPFQEPAK